jgi:hypothetical protein
LTPGCEEASEAGGGKLGLGLRGRGGHLRFAIASQVGQDTGVYVYCLYPTPTPCGQKSQLMRTIQKKGILPTETFFKRGQCYDFVNIFATKNSKKLETSFY